MQGTWIAASTISTASLEDLRGHQRASVAEDVALSPTLRTILARQSLIMSAMFNLTEMVEDLLLASGKPRKPVFDTRNEGGDAGTSRSRAKSRPARRRFPGHDQDSAGETLAVHSTDFGVLRRRRRRGVLAILVALPLAACLAWTVAALIGADNAESSVPRVSETDAEPPGAPNIAAGWRSSPEEQIKVPDVSGRSLEEAVRIISDAGFEVADIRTEASRRAPKRPSKTHPTAGAPTKPGAPVILTMSAAPTVAPTATASTSASAR